MIEYIIKKYNELRYMNRGIIFKKRNQIDLTTIEDVTDYFQVGHIQGVIVNNEGKDILMIFGSNEILDWLFNFSFRFFKETPYPSVTRNEIKVHKGFYRSYLKIRDYVLQKFKDHKELYIFGQSLGAAVATFATLDLKYNHPEMNIKPIVTGSPKVGNYDFKQSFEKRIHNFISYVNGGDIITTVPPKMFGYVHVGQRKFIGKKKFLMLSIKDHMVTSYLKNL